MSHLKLVIDYRSYLNDFGVDCAANQTKATQEAFIRALIMFNCKMDSSFHINDTIADRIWEQLDTWNSIFPINGRFILESAKSRLGEMHKALSQRGNLSNTSLYEVIFDTTTHNAEGEVVPSRFDATDNTPFVVLVEYLYKELVAGHE